MKQLQQKQDALVEILRGFPSLMVAFSGGVDSTYLLSVAHEVLKEDLVAVTSVSPIHSGREIADSRLIAERIGVRQIIIETDEMQLPEFRANPRNRCYICKQNMFRMFWDKAAELGIPAICHGANIDDLEDIRPGHAAAQEYDIHAPLIDAGLHKADIRQLSKRRGLPTWNRPAMACLATRIPFGTTIQIDMLQMIESAEAVLHEAGFPGCRVRCHGEIARIEIYRTDFRQIIDPKLLSTVVPAIRNLGFTYVTLDLEGYTQGSLNRPGSSGGKSGKT